MKFISYFFVIEKILIYNSGFTVLAEVTTKEITQTRSSEFP